MVCTQEDQREAQSAPGLSALADAAAQAARPQAQAEPAVDEDMMDGMDEELRAALQMSLQVRGYHAVPVLELALGKVSLFIMLGQPGAKQVIA